MLKEDLPFPKKPHNNMQFLICEHVSYFTLTYNLHLFKTFNMYLSITYFVVFMTLKAPIPFLIHHWKIQDKPTILKFDQRILPNRL